MKLFNNMNNRYYPTQTRQSSTSTMSSELSVYTSRELEVNCGHILYHNLDRLPIACSVHLICKTGNNGYQIGENYPRNTDSVTMTGTHINISKINYLKTYHGEYLTLSPQMCEQWRMVVRAW